MNRQENQIPEHTLSNASSGWAASSSFLGSILSGTLLGYLGDMWFDTKPWMILIGFLLGAYSGFMRLWHLSKSFNYQPPLPNHGDD